MAQPKTVKKQAKKAAKLQKELIDAQEAEANPDNKDEQQTELSLVGDPPADPPVKTDQEGNWEERFKGLKATHDTTVSGLRSQLNDASGRLETATNQIADLTTRVEELSKSPPEPSAAQPVKIEVTDEEVEEYGQGLIDLVSKISGQDSSSTVDLAKQVLDLEKRLNAVAQDTKQVGETHVKDKRAEFFTELDTAVPNWRLINKDAKFMSWLADEMPGTGEERQFYLQQHFDKYDVARTSKLFNEFLAANGAPVNTQAELEEQLQPSNTNAATINSNVNTNEKIWTRSEIKLFYREKREGKYRSKPDDARRIEKDILAATAQGRVKD